MYSRGAEASCYLAPSDVLIAQLNDIVALKDAAMAQLQQQLRDSVRFAHLTGL